MTGYSVYAWYTLSTILVTWGVVSVSQALAPEGSLLYKLSSAVPSAVWRLAGALHVQWIGQSVSWLFHALLYKRHPIIQILYVGIIGGSFGAFYVFGFPDRGADVGLWSNKNPYFAAHHINEAWVLLVASLGFFAAASFLDPGVITHANVDAHLAAYPLDNILYVAEGRKLCDTCKLPRPARSKHCSVCNHCVSRFDHHCIWLNACVGERTYRWFLLYLLANALIMIYGAWASWAICWHDIVRGNLRQVNFRGIDGNVIPASAWLIFSYLMGTRLEILMVGILCTLMGTIVIGFLVYHAWLTATNQTTNETFKWSDLTEARDAWAARFNRNKVAVVEETRRLEVARAGGDADGEIESSARLEDLRRPKGRDGVRRLLFDPGAVPRNFYDKGMRINCSQVFWPLLTRVSSSREKAG